MRCLLLLTLIVFVTCTPTGEKRRGGEAAPGPSASLDVAAMSADEVKAQRELLAGLLVSDPSPARRARIAAALGYTARDEASIPALAHALSVERDVSVQRRLVAVLLGFQPPEALDAVVRFAMGAVDASLQEELISGLAGAAPSKVSAAIDTHSELSPRRAATLREALK